MESRWNYNPLSMGQGLVIAEDTGDTVAVVYDGARNGHRIALLPDMIEALEAATEQLEQCASMFRDDREFMRALRLCRAVEARG